MGLARKMRVAAVVGREVKEGSGKKKEREPEVDLTKGKTTTDVQAFTNYRGVVVASTASDADAA